MTATARIRKAWLIQSDEWDAIVYAPTRSKAVYELYAQSERSWSFREYLDEIHIRRAAEKDVRVPDRHPLAAQLDPRILSCVVHAYGGTGFKAGYREHYVTSDRDPMPKAAYYHGLFEMHRVPRRIAGDMDSISYILTQLGKNVARGEAETYPRW